jgi:hypothetical protein
MKIYINHLNLDALPEILKTLTNNYINSETYIQIYSSDGIYEIKNSSSKKLIPMDSDIQILQNYHDKFTLLLDQSYYNIEETFQINNDHISRKMKRCFFELNQNSKIKLVIEGEVLDDKHFYKRISNEYGIAPNDIYFELPEKTNINDTLVKNELIVFLSCLN